jgi:hypothetical protein
VASRELAPAAQPSALSAASARLDDELLAPRIELLALIRDKQAAQAALTSLLAWGITVAPAAFARTSPLAARATAVAAVAAGVAGALLVAARPRIGRALGVTAFLTLTTATWLLAPAALHPDRLDPIHASLGSVALALYAFSWRAPRPRLRSAHADGRQPSLEARARLPRSVVPVAALSIGAALLCMTLAWRTRELERALLAQATALLCATALISAGTVIALRHDAPRASGSRRLSAPAWRALLAFGGVLLVGTVLLWFAR